MLCARRYEPECIIAIDRSLERLTFAKEHHMADVTYCPQDISALEAQIRSLTSGRGADAVLEAAGESDTFEMAWRIARPNAVVVLVAMYEKAQILPLPEMYGKNLTWKSGGVDACHLDDILTLIEEGRLDATPLLTHKCRLSEIQDAYQVFEAQADGVLKYAVYPD